ncbi:hypothetical protein VP01_7786g1 [Puccinia sorghi]|uniref:Uncharacterized protein n=1 Tax=Puccinia sorghi TaxID=27349 RepID=A0A0L6UC36_9BASI|nr:hypothetical protein VP01_7786g1 [Puccinia sorghi]
MGAGTGGGAELWYSTHIGEGLSVNTTWADDLKTRLLKSGSISELNALSDGLQQNQWIKFIIEELYNKKLNLTQFNIGNKGLLDKMNHFGSNSKTKHLNTKQNGSETLKTTRKYLLTKSTMRKKNSDTQIHDAQIQTLRSTMLRSTERSLITTSHSTNPSLFIPHFITPSILLPLLPCPTSTTQLDITQLA